MRTRTDFLKTSRHVFALCLACTLLSAQATASPETAIRSDKQAEATVAVDTLAPALEVGDVVFIRVTAKPFREVAATTGSWTNHVGVVIETSGAQPLIGESTFPFSRTTTLSRFVGRSEDGRVAVARLKREISAEQQEQVRVAAEARAGIFYDTGFNLHSKGQFCSRYVREVLEQATGTSVGQVETFAALLARRPETNVGFWKVWYFGRIPWTRETVTPASLLESPEMRLIYDGKAVPAAAPGTGAS